MFRYFGLFLALTLVLQSRQVFAIDFKKALKETVEKEKKKFEEQQKKDEEKKAEETRKAEEAALNKMTPAQRIRFAWQNYAFYSDGCGYNPTPSKKEPKDTDATGLMLACRIVGLVDIKAMEKMSGQKVFSAGPHTNERVDFSSRSFGQFNPKFVDWAVNNAIPAANDKAFKLATQKIYEDYFQPNVEGFLRTIYALESVPKVYAQIQKDYAAEVATGTVIFPTVFLESYLEKIPSTYFGIKTIAFWVRRGTDGSAPSFKRGLEKLVKTYTPDRLKVIKAEATAKAPAKQ